MAGCFQDVIGGGSNDAILAVVPMFHVSAWGLVYSAAMVGAKLVMPGPGLDGANLTKIDQPRGRDFDGRRADRLVRHL